MNRPEIDIIIPVQRETAQLERTVDLISHHTANYRLTVLTEPGLNVSEARQKALDEVAVADVVCFLDDDSEMVMDGWLERMYAVLSENADAGAVFGGEWWGSDDAPEISAEATDGREPCCEVDRGPAACMLLDRRRLVPGVEWDRNIGLRSGWLGGDFEEVDYCHRLRRAGLRLLRATGTLFHHTGGKRAMRDFRRTDRFRSVNAMELLLRYKYAKAPDDDDWFSGLTYVRARDDDDCLLAPGQSLAGCYAEVIRRNGLTHVRSFSRMGLI